MIAWLDIGVTLAQQGNPPANDAAYEAGYFFGQMLFCCCCPLIFFLLFGFWLWMLIDCCTRTFPGENEKLTWVLVIVFAYAIGALIYLIVGRPKGARQ